MAHNMAPYLNILLYFNPYETHIYLVKWIWHSLPQCTLIECHSFWLDFCKSIWLCFTLEVSVLIRRHVINNLWTSSIFQSDYFHKNTFYLILWRQNRIFLNQNLIPWTENGSFFEPSEPLNISYGTSYSFIFATVSMICCPGKFSRCIACFKLYISLKSFDLSSELQILKGPFRNIHTCTHMYIFITSVQVNFVSLHNLLGFNPYLMTTKLIVR